MSMNFVTFNQDYSHLAVGTTRGYRIYTTDPFSTCFESKQGDVALVEMLFSTSLVALVLSPRRLQITNTKRQSTICELTFPTSVLAVRMNRKRLVVVLEDQIYLYDISNMKLLYTIETSPNPHAICTLSPSSESCYLAYPLPQKAAPSSFAPPSHAPPGGAHIQPTSGDVLLFDTTKLEAINVVEAHRSPLSCIAVNDAGTLLATASDKGTIIRVFSLPAATKLYQFRRGSMPSRICSMAFNATSTLLCVSSASDTVHIFKLDAASQRQPQQRRPSLSTTKSTTSTSSSPPRISAFTPPYNRDRSLSPTADTESDSITSSTQNQQSGPNPSDPISVRKPNGTFMGLIRRTSQSVGTSVAASVGAYLPSAVSEMWEPTRDFAWLKIPKSPTSPGGGLLGGRDLKSVVAMSSDKPQVMVVTSEGRFYVFGIDLEKGGEGTLVKVYEIGGEGERLGTSVLGD